MSCTSSYVMYVRVVCLLFEMCGVFGDGIIDGIIILLSSS